MDKATAIKVAAKGSKEVLETLRSKDTSHRGARKIVTALAELGLLNKGGLQAKVQDLLVGRWGIRR